MPKRSPTAIAAAESRTEGSDDHRRHVVTDEDDEADTEAGGRVVIAALEVTRPGI